MPVAIEGEHLPTEVVYDPEMQSGQYLVEDNEQQMSFPVFCAEILQLCKPTVSSTVLVARLRPCRM
jgi:hypothetical protein